MDDNSQRKEYVLASMAAFSTALAITILGQGRYVFSSFLTADDTIFVGRAAFGQAMIPPDHPGIFVAIEWLAPIVSITTIKLISVAFFGVLAASCCLWLMLAGTASLTAFVLGVWIAVYPVAVDQGFFVSGSHPTIGSALLVASAATVLSTIQRSEFIAGGGLVIAGGMAILARLISPNLFLATFMPLTMVAALWLALGLPSRKAWRLSVLALLPIAFTIFYGSGYHYSGIVGWTSPSISTGISNLIEGVRVAILPLFGTGPYAFLIAGCAALSILFVVFLKRSSVGSGAWRGAALMCIAALTFAPSAITAFYFDRYAVAPFVFTALALATVIGPILAESPRPLKLALGLGLIVLGVIADQNGIARRDATFSRQLEAHRAVETIVAATSAEWPKDAQVVIALEPPLISPTGGFNHWSTWYVRLLAKRSDIIALVGPASALSAKPWVDKYADHGPEYWAINNGISQRVPMLGIEKDRPLVAFLVDPSLSLQSLCPAPVHFSDGVIVQPGQTVNGVGEPVFPCVGPPLNWAVRYSVLKPARP